MFIITQDMRHHSEEVDTCRHEMTPTICTSGRPLCPINTETNTKNDRLAGSTSIHESTLHTPWAHVRRCSIHITSKGTRLLLPHENASSQAVASLAVDSLAVLPNLGSELEIQRYNREGR